MEINSTTSVEIVLVGIAIYMSGLLYWSYRKVKKHNLDKKGITN